MFYRGILTYNKKKIVIANKLSGLAIIDIIR